MNAHRILAFMLTVLVGSLLHAQQTSATDYFNRAAKEYVKQDKHAALHTLDMGLRAYPGDARMLKLAEELLKDEQQQPQQQKQQQEQQQQEEQQKKEQEQQAQQQKEEQGKEGEEQQRSEKRKGGIGKEDAERMLDAVERKEQDVQDQVRAKLRPARRVPIDKDW